jgi:hypothetical protein
MWKIGADSKAMTPIESTIGPDKSLGSTDRDILIVSIDHYTGS